MSRFCMVPLAVYGNDSIRCSAGTRRTAAARAGATCLILVLFVSGWGGGFGARNLWAQEPPHATANPNDLSVQDIRGRLQLLDKEHSLAIAEEDYDKAGRIVQEINRLDEELLRRHWEAPIPRPPDTPPPRR